MDKATFAALFFVLLYAGWEVHGLYSSRHLMEPLYIYDQFVGADRAVERCGGAEAGEREKFLRNLDSVTRDAGEDLAEKHPEEDAGAIEARLAELRQEREAEVDALIEAQGCDGKEVWTLLRLHKMRARLNLR
jgi:hypothetical protein